MFAFNTNIKKIQTCNWYTIKVLACMLIIKLIMLKLKQRIVRICWNSIK
jgi:hypothetical protein